MMGGGSDDRFNEMSSKWWAVVVTIVFNEMSSKWWAVVATIVFNEVSSKWWAVVVKAVLMKCPVNDGRW